MAVQDRVIGGGYLIVGGAIIVVLLVLLTGGGMSAEEARDQLLSLYATYRQAGEREDYLEQQRVADKATDIIEEVGRAAIDRALLGAQEQERDAVIVRSLIEQGTFAQNAEGLFQLSGEWFEMETYRDLIGLQKVLTGPVKRALHPSNRDSVRGMARTALKALEEARTGSGRPLPLPEVAVDPEEDPVVAEDRQLYRVFGLEEKELAAALKSTGGSKSARLRWDRDVATSDLGELMRSVPGHTRGLRKAADAVERHGGALEKTAEAKAAFEQLMKRAAAMVAPGRADEERQRYQKAKVLAELLRAEAEALEPHLADLPLLAVVFEQRFAP